MLLTIKHGVQYHAAICRSNTTVDEGKRILIKPVILALWWHLQSTPLHIFVPMTGQNAQAPLSQVRVIFPKCLHRALQISHGLLCSCKKGSLV